MAEITIDNIFEARKTAQEETRKKVREAMVSAVNQALERGLNARDINEARAMVTVGNYTLYFSEVMPSDKAWLLENYRFVVYELNDDIACVKPDGLDELIAKQKAQDDALNGIQ